MSNQYLLTLQCSDGPGLIKGVADVLLAYGANIVEQAQFTDPEAQLFCLRTRFETDNDDVIAMRASLIERLAHREVVVSLRRADVNRRVIVLVSKADHCLEDLLYRHKLGELRLDIPVVVSNHDTLRPVAERYGIPFVVLPVTADTRRTQEAAILQLVREHAADGVVLARYMQILSDEFCAQLPRRIINIHHSFLPGFKGARPYHQAHERGVKIIGATAHFVTADLDEGPIIEQDVQRVAHNYSADDLVAIGRDIERRVLSRAVGLFAEDRIFLIGARTIVFA
jgi:formyltetrahydrofolate deformylase